MFQSYHTKTISHDNKIQVVLGIPTRDLSLQYVFATVIGKIVEDMAEKVYISTLDILLRKDVMCYKSNTVFELIRHMRRSVLDDVLEVLDHKHWLPEALGKADADWSPTTTNIDDSRGIRPVKSLYQRVHIRSRCKATHSSSEAEPALWVQTEFIIESSVSIVTEREPLLHKLG